jgi:hypothetical protein
VCGKKDWPAARSRNPKIAVSLIDIFDNFRDYDNIVQKYAVIGDRTHYADIIGTLQ